MNLVKVERKHVGKVNDGDLESQMGGGGCLRCDSKAIDLMLIIGNLIRFSALQAAEELFDT